MDITINPYQKFVNIKNKKNLSIKNHVSPAFKAKIVVDDSFKNLGESANQEILPKLEKYLSKLGNDSTFVTLKGEKDFSDLRWDKIIANITKIRKNKKSYISKNKPYEYAGLMDSRYNGQFGAFVHLNKFVTEINNVITNKKNFSGFIL